MSLGIEKYLCPGSEISKAPVLLGLLFLARLK
jgi:hypothetical protein